MLTTSLLSKTKTHENQANVRPLRGYLFTAGATFAGVAFGVLMSVGFMRPMLHQEVASATDGLDRTTLTAQPANSFISCAEMPSGGKGGGAVMGAQTTTSPTPNHATSPSASTPSTGGKGGGKGGGAGGGEGKTIFVHKLVSGMIAKTSASNRNTGADSTNVIKTTNTNTTKVENHNDITLTNNNPQTASSGDVTSTQNTKAGTATSGDATNTSQASFDIKIQN